MTMTSFLHAMIPPHVQDEMRQRVFPCPNEPPCSHSGLVHEIGDWDDPLPRCCSDDCDCGTAERQEGMRDVPVAAGEDGKR